MKCAKEFGLSNKFRHGKLKNLANVITTANNNEQKISKHFLKDSVKVLFTELSYEPQRENEDSSVATFTFVKSHKPWYILDQKFYKKPNIEPRKR